MTEPTQFTAHNIQLDDGSRTRPAQAWLTADDEWCRAARRLLRMLYPGGGEGRRIADLGCLEGGFAVEFARMGFETLGIEARQSNIDNCERVRAGLSLPNLGFRRDDAWNIASHGMFDVVFCCGLLYHIDRPAAFIRRLAGQSRRALVLNTHFATDRPNDIYGLSEIATHEGFEGRWFHEYDPAEIDSEAALDKLKWASWGNDRAFWLKREHIFDCLRENGFDLVFEQMDCISDARISESMQRGYYRQHDRGMFVGVRQAG